MMHAIVDIFKVLIKWGVFLLVLVLVLKIVTFFVPWLSQSNLKDKLEPVVESSTTTVKRRGLLPKPGSWNLLGTSTVNSQPVLQPNVPSDYYNQSGYVAPSVPN